MEKIMKALQSVMLTFTGNEEQIIKVPMELWIKLSKDWKKLPKTEMGPFQMSVRQNLKTRIFASDDTA